METNLSLSLSAAQRDFFYNLPKKLDWATLYVQYSHKAAVEMVNGKIIHLSENILAGKSQHFINAHQQNYGAQPLAARANNTILALNNKQRVALLKKAEKIFLNKTVNFDGLAFKWESSASIVHITNPQEQTHIMLREFCTLSVQIRIKKGGKSFYGLVNHTIVDEKRLQKEEIVQLIAKAQIKAEQNALAQSMKAGQYAVLFAKGCSGLLFHELLGHALEADYIHNQHSIFAAAIGQQIAPEKVTLYDTAYELNSVFDDEAMEKRETILVEKGTIKNVLTDRYHALNMGQKETGNGRRLDFSSPVLPRMQHTIVAAGSIPEKEMLESFKSGIYIEALEAGDVQPTDGSFSILCNSAFMVANGERGDALKPFTIAGNIVETLQNIVQLGSELGTIQQPVMCVKEQQALPVKCSGPMIKIKNIDIITD